MSGTATLTLAAFLQLAAQCGDGVPPEILAGISRTESGYNVLALNVNAGGKGNTVSGVATLSQAKSVARELLSKKKSFDAGIMQINNSNWAWLGLSIDNVFDPCINIRAAATLLKSFGRYNAGTGEKGIRNGYAGKAWENLRQVSRVSRETPPPARTAIIPSKPACPIPKPSRFDGWGVAKWEAMCSKLKIAEK